MKQIFNRNLLYLAAKNGFYDICVFLLEKGFDPNIQQGTQSTPLHAAAYYKHDSIVYLLLEYGAKTNIKNNGGNTALDEAFSYMGKQYILESRNDTITCLFHELEKNNQQRD